MQPITKSSATVNFYVIPIAVECEVYSMPASGVGPKEVGQLIADIMASTIPTIRKSINQKFDGDIAFRNFAVHTTDKVESVDADAPSS